jgi:hypothetical protein
VAPLVEEGVDAALDSLAELARARHHEAFGKHRLPWSFSVCSQLHGSLAELLENAPPSRAASRPQT